MIADTYRTVVTIALAAMLASPVAGGPDENPGDERRALERAVRLVSLEPGLRVVLIEPELAPDPEPLRGLDAFVVREPNGALRPVIYINRASEIVRDAAGGSELHVFMLAAVIHHEARHLAGATEDEARRSELAFFEALVTRTRSPSDTELRYLQLLTRQASAIKASPPDRD